MGCSVAPRRRQVGVALYALDTTLAVAGTRPGLGFENDSVCFTQTLVAAGSIECKIFTTTATAG